VAGTLIGVSVSFDFVSFRGLYWLIQYRPRLFLLLRHTYRVMCRGISDMVGVQKYNPQRQRCFFKSLAMKLAYSAMTLFLRVECRGGNLV